VLSTTDPNIAITDSNGIDIEFSIGLTTGAGFIYAALGS